MSHTCRLFTVTRCETGLPQSLSSKQIQKTGARKKKKKKDRAVQQLA